MSLFSLFVPVKCLCVFIMRAFILVVSVSMLYVFMPLHESALLLCVFMFFIRHCNFAVCLRNASFCKVQ